MRCTEVALVALFARQRSMCHSVNAGDYEVLSLQVAYHSSLHFVLT